MTANEVEVILGLAAVVAVSLLLWAALRRGGTGSAVISVAEILHAEVHLGATDRAAATEALRTAAQQKGETDLTPAEQGIDRLTTTRLARVLWVDDNPDHNRYETVALERTGLLVTKATSTEAGEFYFRQLPFSLIITDVARGIDRQAGRKLLASVRTSRPDLPVIIYTMDADSKRADLLGAGAAAVVDMPGDLMAAVQSIRPR